MGSPGLATAQVDVIVVPSLVVHAEPLCHSATAVRSHMGDLPEVQQVGTITDHIHVSCVLAVAPLQKMGHTMPDIVIQKWAQSWLKQGPVKSGTKVAEHVGTGLLPQHPIGHPEPHDVCAEFNRHLLPPAYLRVRSPELQIR